MKTYIAGKVTGTPLKDARLKFEAAEKEVLDLVLSLEASEVINPMRLCAEQPDLTWEQYMLIGIEQLFTCTHIYMLRDWQGSKGARIEHAIATTIGLIILYQENNTSSL